MVTDRADWEAKSWAHSVDMYQKWARLENARMMEMHRERFPKCKKIFDKIDVEISQENTHG